MSTLNTAECTCQSRDCYSCRRQEIDANALRIIEREMQYGDSEHAEYVAACYRYPAINALAFEL